MIGSNWEEIDEVKQQLLPLDFASCFFRKYKPRNMGKQIQYFPFSGTFASRFHYQKEKTIQNWAPTIIYQSVFWWKQTDSCILHRKALGAQWFTRKRFEMGFPVFCPISLCEAWVVQWSVCWTLGPTVRVQVLAGAWRCVLKQDASLTLLRLLG